MSFSLGCSRRSFLGGLAWGAALLSAPGAWAEELVQTPDQTEGPFYPDHLPLDTDNDLVVINDALDSAVGEITYLSGRILDSAGNPVRNAVVEIWQVDSNAAYLHTGSDNHDRRDGNFQGFGRFTTGRTGEYLFRTIKPVPYPGRTPHIHVAVNVKGQPKFATQCYIKDHPGNARDFVLANVRDQRARESLLVDFAPLEGSRIGELAATFDVVLGFTPEG